MADPVRTPTCLSDRATIGVCAKVDRSDANSGWQCSTPSNPCHPPYPMQPSPRGGATEPLLIVLQVGPSPKARKTRTPKTEVPLPKTEAPLRATSDPVTKVEAAEAVRKSSPFVELPDRGRCAWVPSSGYR